MGDTEQSWQEWCAVLQAEVTNTCMSCGGWGNHGYDDEGREMVCHACYGTGKYDVK